MKNLIKITPLIFIVLSCIFIPNNNKFPIKAIFQYEFHINDVTRSINSDGEIEESFEISDTLMIYKKVYNDKG